MLGLIGRATARMNERSERLRRVGDHIAAGGDRRAVLAERYDALHGRVDTTELARMFGALDAERPGSWRWARRAEELRRAIGAVERTVGR